MIIFIPFCVSLAGFEVTEEGPLLPSEPEQGMPEVDPEVETPGPVLTLLRRYLMLRFLPEQEQLQLERVLLLLFQ